MVLCSERTRPSQCIDVGRLRGVQPRFGYTLSISASWAASCSKAGNSLSRRRASASLGGCGSAQCNSASSFTCTPEALAFRPSTPACINLLPLLQGLGIKNLPKCLLLRWIFCCLFHLLIGGRIPTRASRLSFQSPARCSRSRRPALHSCSPVAALVSASSRGRCPRDAASACSSSCKPPTNRMRHCQE